MRCYCCNHVLSTAESTRKFAESGNYTEMCNTCLATIDDDELSLEDGAYEEEPEDD